MVESPLSPYPILGRILPLCSRGGKQALVMREVTVAARRLPSGDK
jgi:hypothetical protein